MKKDYQPKARLDLIHLNELGCSDRNVITTQDQLRTRIEKDKTKYDRNHIKQLDLYEDESKRLCDCWLNTGECYCKTI